MVTIYILLALVLAVVAGIYFFVIKKMQSNIEAVSKSLPKSYLSQKDIDTSVSSMAQKIHSEIGDWIGEIENKIAKLKEEPDNVERFLFFSDPHPFVSMDKVEWEKDNKLDRMKEYLDVSGSNFIICGGDWLTDHNKQTAIDDLKLAEKTMQEMFGAKYYPLLGNHDNNDKVEEVDHDEIVRIMFNRWGKAYYTFKGKRTRFYVFDTGSIAHLQDDDDYKKEQTKWFINNLLSNDDEHIVIVMHMAQIMDDGGPISSPQAVQLSEVADTFNKRDIYDGYNFGNATGKVHIILAGHWHEDNNYMLNNIPVYIIDDAQEGNFDMVLMDYDNNQLRTVRVGSGENRVIEI